MASIAFAATGCGGSSGDGGTIPDTADASMGTDGSKSLDASQHPKDSSAPDASPPVDIDASDSGSDSGGCAPTTCQALGANCGSVGDNCGNLLQCGSCTAPQTCGGGNTPNVCGAPACTPKTCASQGFTCGMASDGCNGLINCGTCATGMTCGSASTNVCGTTPCVAKTCAQQGFNCGMESDTCGTPIDCGTCTGNQVCGGGAAPSPGVCGTPVCTPTTCAQQNFNCGMASDGCNGVINCGTCTGGQVCGAQMPNVCGGVVCTPKTCAQQNFNCGMQGDTCGNTIDCGTCAAGEICGGGANPQPGICGAPACTPKTCAQQNFNCGMATDGCTGVIDCGTCSGHEICGGGGANVCGTSATCTGLCLQQQVCPGTATTSISGTVYAPNGTDPLPNTLVYVPNGGPAPAYGVLPFTPGVHCGSCGSEVSGSPLVSAVTGYDGKFTITNMPVGMNIPLVIQNGRWRRQFVIPNVASCVNTPMPTTGAGQIRMPRTDVVHAGGEGDIPLMAFVTGSVDALECVLRKVGIADSEFSNPSGTGRVRFYQGSGSAGSTYSATTPSETTLWGSQATINQYDMTYFACQGNDFEKTAAQQQIVVNYANAGGRVFATHYSYVWLTNTAENAVWSPTANWSQANEGTFASDPQTGYINTTFPRGLELAQWLQVVGASSTQGQIQIQTLRNDFTSVVAPSELWINVNDVGGLGNVPMHYTFDTPVGAQPANQCGRVLYSDFHVEDAVTSGTTFPQECTVAGMTPQEKMLEFMIFDLGACVAPPVCTPKTCAQLGDTCGPAGDGCGNILQCGMCPSGEVCVAGTCSPGCTSKTCASQNFTCGAQGDGCGNILQCGTCPAGQTCSNGVCGTSSCTPKSCAQQNVMCGSTGDGCGNILQCGSCPAGQSCGGGGTPGVCGTPACKPKSCAQLGANCGMTTDGCGNTINCGTCTGIQTCGGCHTANVCCSG